MRTGISISVSDGDRRRPEAIVADRNASRKHVWRSRIILLTAQGIGMNGILTTTGTLKTTVWRWEKRCMHSGIDGRLRDTTRPPGKAPVPVARVEDVARLTLAQLLR